MKAFDAITQAIARRTSKKLKHNRCAANVAEETMRQRAIGLGLSSLMARGLGAIAADLARDAQNHGFNRGVARQRAVQK